LVAVQEKMTNLMGYCKALPVGVMQRVDPHCPCGAFMAKKARGAFIQREFLQAHAKR
jgi:hypothetical protein